MKIIIFNWFVRVMKGLRSVSVVVVTAALLLSGCYHRSKLKHENGSVIEKQYFPDTNQDVIGTGVSSNGSLVITTHHIGENEKYIVIFKCSHGVIFSINRSDLYGKLNKNDHVIIDYYELLDYNNQIKDLDFIDAIAIK